MKTTHLFCAPWDEQIKPVAEMRLSEVSAVKHVSSESHLDRTYYVISIEINDEDDFGYSDAANEIHDCGFDILGRAE